MLRIERLILVALGLLAFAELADFGLDFQLFWLHTKDLNQTDLYLHVLILLLVTAALILAWRLRVYRQKCEVDLGRACDVAGEEQARFDSIVSALGDGVSIQDLDYTVIYQNDRHRELVQRDAQGCFCYQVYAKKDEVCEECPVAKTFKDGKVHRLVKEVLPGRPASHIEIIASPLRNAEGKIVAGIELVRDISLQRERETEIAALNFELQEQAEQLQVVNSELEAFSYSLAHDLRSQLTPLILGAEALISGYRPQLDENGRLFVDSIMNSGEKIEQIVDGMLVLGKIRSQELERDHFDISNLVREVIDDLSRSEPDRRVSWDITPSLTAWGDVRLIRIALQNLIHNALKYTSLNDTATITFGLSREGGVERFFVRDDGVGFDSTKAAGLFQPFKRFHGNEYEGSGIGLATVQRVVQRHGGTIDAKSMVDQGTTFYFSLPGKGTA